MRTDQFDYNLPHDRIAQTPLPRGEARMLVLNRSNGEIDHRYFQDFPNYLSTGDVIVLNNTRVTARRLKGVRPGGESAEILLLRPIGDKSWEALVRPGKGLKPGRALILEDPSRLELPINVYVTAVTSEGGRILEFPDSISRNRVAEWGGLPLPPYIQSTLSKTEEERYQTVFGIHPGSAAAPTAGLHFTEQMLTQIRKFGTDIAAVTLHIGIDTFRPVRTENIEDHIMHGEYVSVSNETANLVNGAKGRVIAIGTTSVRCLETSAQASRSKAASVTENSTEISASSLAYNRITPFSGETHLYITPGYRFNAVDALLTNFHLPKSTLLMMVSAFAGYEYVMRAYNEAIRCGYRFYSFGDAMLII